MEECHFTKSASGHPQIIDYQGHRYAKNRNATETKVYWLCVFSQKNRGHCRARIATEGFYIIKRSNEHNHKPNEPAEKRPHGNSKVAKLAKLQEEKKKNAIKMPKEWK